MHLFLDFTLSKHLADKFASNNTVIVYVSWFSSLFPNEQQINHALMMKLNKMIQPTFLQRVIAYQLHRAHVFRQSSASKEANDDFARIKNISDSLVNENIKFWNKMRTTRTTVATSTLLKVANIKKKAKAKWHEMIDKYPNNSRFAAAYSNFLIEGCGEYREGIRWYNRGQELDQGKKRKSDNLFKAFILTMPEYLKRGYVKVNGDINKKRGVIVEADGSQASSNSTGKTSSNGVTSTATSSNESDGSDFVDLSQSENVISHSQLRLAFESSMQLLNSSVSHSVVTSIICKAIGMVIIAVLTFVLLFNIFDENSVFLEHLSLINKIEQRTAATAHMSFWAIAYAIAPYTGAEAATLFGPDYLKIPNYFNYTQKTSEALGNISVFTGKAMDDVSNNLYYTETSSTADKILIYFLAQHPVNSVTCIDPGTGPIISTEEDGRIDNQVRSIIIKAVDVATKLETGVPVANLLKSIELCEVWGYYEEFQESLNIWTMNISTIYANEYNNTLVNPDNTSVYLGDEKSNAPELPEEVESSVDNI